MNVLAEIIEAFRGPHRQKGLDIFRNLLSRGKEEEAVHIIHLLNGRPPSRSITRKQLRSWAAEATAIPPWLFDESLETVGDLMETAALVIPRMSGSEERSVASWLRFLASLPECSENTRKERVVSAWKDLDLPGRVLFNRLITGSFRSGVRSKDLVDVLASMSGRPPALIAQRLARNWNPDTTALDSLLGNSEPEDHLFNPYHFMLASLLDDSPQSLGRPADWQAEWLWDGLRAQVLKLRGNVCVWSRTEELLTEDFPELLAAATLLPDGTALDGEIIALDGNTVLPVSDVISSRGKRSRSLRHKHLVFIAHDILQHQSSDVRALPLQRRRAFLVSLLEALHRHDVFRISPLVSFGSWDALAHLKDRGREHGAKGIILKRLASRYLPGRTHGEWRKWKVSPLSIKTALLYAHTVQGHRERPPIEYTFAVRDGGGFIPCVRTAVGLSEQEAAEIAAFVRGHTVERFGPVHSVQPSLVFEIGFDAIHPSPRRKSGVMLISPRVIRWHREKKPEEAETLDQLRGLLTRATFYEP